MASPSRSPLPSGLPGDLPVDRAGWSPLSPGERKLFGTGVQKLVLVLYFIAFFFSWLFLLFPFSFCVMAKVTPRLRHRKVSIRYFLHFDFLTFCDTSSGHAHLDELACSVLFRGKFPFHFFVESLLLAGWKEPSPDFFCWCFFFFSSFRFDPTSPRKIPRHHALFLCLPVFTSP